MRTKIIAALLAILTALGGLNLYQSIKERLFPRTEASTTAVAMVKTDGVYEYRVSGALAPSKSPNVESPGVESPGVVSAAVGVSSAIAASVSVAVSAALAPSDSGTEVLIDETFKVRDGQTLRIDIAHADVRISTSQTDQARIQVSLQARDMDRAIEVFKDMNFQLESTGDEILLVAESPRRNWNSRWTGGMHITVDASIPESFDLYVETTHGDVDLDDLQGSVDLQTSHGDIDAGNLSGDAEISTSHGDVMIRLIDPADAEVDINTSHGNVVIVAPSSLRADLDLKADRVRVGRGFDFTGSMEKNLADGTLNGGGPDIRARTTHGTVEVRNQ